jgi:predicted aspartyl protease
MMTGTVNARLELLIPLPILDDLGLEQEIETVLDSGFTGSLTLPPAAIAGLGLIWRSQGSAVLANGVVEQFDIYAATVIWDGSPRSILVQAIDTPPLMGMVLLAGHDLRVRVRPGGSVEIEAIP